MVARFDLFDIFDFYTGRAIVSLFIADVDAPTVYCYRCIFVHANLFKLRSGTNVYDKVCQFRTMAQIEYFTRIKIVIELLQIGSVGEQRIIAAGIGSRNSCTFPHPERSSSSKLNNE